ncbi:2Fe-2S iron-sulfur cluster-binding protein [Paracoccus sp. TOH]|uniref:2Fe-2S iron-sulfur cluster-binding protein n=1 Tax=Paracoccus sp. TOH TaxID=1263728 RepID=UPI0025AF4C22|nr:2Fe-2S iron-sulfur cluster-binding protein [Paracoccus sp. TOH]
MTNRLGSGWGSRIDRGRALAFTFEGRRVAGHPGDTIASALAANGEWVLSRSFKYHRPRGILTMCGQDANTLVQIGEEPNVRADLRLASDGIAVTPQNVKGSLRRDRGQIIERFGRFLPVGFYYRTFFGPRRSSWLKLWEPMIRASAGLGTVSTDAAPRRYVKETRHCDVLVVGGGPAGLAAAIRAAEAGAGVILVEKEPELGGALTYARFAADAGLGARHLSALRDRALALPGVSVMTGATCNGRFADNWLPVISGDRLVRIRAAELVLATGAHEQPLVFRNNDLPGIMLSSAAQRLMRHYAVRPGQRAVVYAGDRDGYLAALDLDDAGVRIAAIVDPEIEDRDGLSEELARRGLPVMRGRTLTEAKAGPGGLHLQSVEVQDAAGTRKRLDCDLLVVAGGYTPGYQLALHAGARLASDDTGTRFSITDVPAHLHLAGAAAGLSDLDGVIASGEAAGLRAAAALGLTPAPEGAVPAACAWRRSAPVEPHPKGRDFVDFDEDLQVKDIENAVADGYRELELVKRYSTVGMGPSQGRHAALPTARIVARKTARSLAEVGITTSRPPFGPEKLGLLADTTPERYRHTALHPCHVQAGARMMPVGAWWRPFVYPGSEPPAEAILREIRAVREDVGMLDVSTLGKLELRGRDAAAFLDRIYTMAHAGQPVGRVRYCLALNEMGSILDDGVAFRMSEQHFYVTATTGAVDRLFAEMTLQKAIWGMQVDIQNVTAAFAAINLTGPKARAVLQGLAGDIDFSREAFGFLDGREGMLAGSPVRVMRIGFTGELSYEIHLPQSHAVGMWQALAAAGADLGLRPYGLEASRILRLEKGHIIIGQDTDALSTPDQLGMGWALSRKKPFYTGKAAVEARRALGETRQLCGFVLEGGNAAEVGESALVLHDGQPVGHVTSFGHSPSVGKWIGLAYAPPEQAVPGAQIRIKGFSGTEVSAAVVALPFYDPTNARQEI